MNEVEFLFDGPEKAVGTFLFAHGAGAPMDSPFMTEIARTLGNAGIRVYRFEFPYMAARRSGARKGPDKQAILIDSWHSALAQFADADNLYIGGKSLGGRIATMIADDADVEGVICFGYPFLL